MLLICSLKFSNYRCFYYNFILIDVIDKRKKEILYLIVVFDIVIGLNKITFTKYFREKMKVNNTNQSENEIECLLCHQQFTADPRVKNQRVCSQADCQWLRQKLNNLSWSNKNPVDYEKWYQVSTINLLRNRK